MKKIIAVIYWMFKSDKDEMPYLRTLMIVMLGSVLHGFQIIFLVSIVTNQILFQKSEASRSIQWFWASVCLIVLIFILSLTYRKKELDKIVVTESKIQRARFYIPVYFTVSILLLMIIALFYKTQLFG